MTQVNNTSAIADWEKLGLTRPPVTTDSNKDMGQGDFLKLMTTQLRNQDPFKPMESGEFLTQIAQFGTSTGIQQLQESFSDLANSLYSNQALMASNLVGRKVLIMADKANLGTEGSITGAVKMPYSGEAQVIIKDSSGQTVKTLVLGPKAAGSATFQWDGTDTNGVRLPPGEYQMSAEIVSGNGSLTASITMEKTVSSVSLARNGEELTLNLAEGGTTSLVQVQEIL